MIFPSIEHELVLQVNDRTRLDASKTYSDKSGPVITKVEIQPYAGGPQINVTNVKASEWYTDYQYASAGAKVITVTINSDSTPVTITSTITVKTVADDALFSADTDLVQEEPDITKYVRKGRNTFKDVHREAQREILDLLDRKGYKGPDQSRLTASQAVAVDQVRTMSKYLALHLIYLGLSNVVDDVFFKKSAVYWSKYLTASDRRIIGFDLNNDGEISPDEGADLRATRMYKH